MGKLKLKSLQREILIKSKSIPTEKSQKNSEIKTWMLWSTKMENWARTRKK